MFNKKNSSVGKRFNCMEGDVDTSDEVTSEDNLSTGSFNIPKLNFGDCEEIDNFPSKLSKKSKHKRIYKIKKEKVDCNFDILFQPISLLINDNIVWFDESVSHKCLSTFHRNPNCIAPIIITFVHHQSQIMEFVSSQQYWTPNIKSYDPIQLLYVPAALTYPHISHVISQNQNYKLFVHEIKLKSVTNKSISYFTSVNVLITKQKVIKIKNKIDIDSILQLNKSILDKLSRTLSLSRRKPVILESPPYQNSRSMIHNEIKLTDSIQNLTEFDLTLSLSQHQLPTSNKKRNYKKSNTISNLSDINKYSSSNIFDIIKDQSILGQSYIPKINIRKNSRRSLSSSYKGDLSQNTNYSITNTVFQYFKNQNDSTNKSLPTNAQLMQEMVKPKLPAQSKSYNSGTISDTSMFTHTRHFRSNYTPKKSSRRHCRIPDKKSSLNRYKFDAKWRMNKVVMLNQQKL